MPFIPAIDEVFVRPPYSLDKNTLPFQSNIFFLPAEHDRLQSLVDEQLNAAMPRGPFRYTVPLSVHRVFLAFYRYERVLSTMRPDMGYLGYLEAMIGFAALRQPHPALPDGDPRKKLPPELVTYLGVVYIGDLTGNGPISDPYTLPILLGRAAYGLPKNPGQIFYEPTSPSLPNGPWVKVWDVPAGGGDLSLATAIRVTPRYPSSLQSRPLVPTAPPDDLQYRVRLSDAFLSHAHLDSLIADPAHDAYRDWRAFATLLGLEGRLRLSEASELIDDPAAVLVELPEEKLHAVAWSNLLWRTKLVGLKEFPDPRTPPPIGNGLGDACYQVIVESPLEETPDHLLDFPSFLYWDQAVEFPAVNRVDLIERFGIIPTSGREVLVGTDAMFHQTGSLVFADPAKVNVWFPL